MTTVFPGSTSQDDEALAARAAVHAALGEPARLRIVDLLRLGDATGSELAAALDMRSNLLAHHLGVLRRAGLVSSHASQGDGRRQYLRLVPSALDVSATAVAAPPRIVFVCTANSARSPLAEALWHRASDVPASSAGTAPADRVNPGAVEAARRRGLTLADRGPQDLHDVVTDRDLVVTVCDLAHESARLPGSLHWSVPDPAREGTAEAFDRAYDELEGRVAALAARFTTPPTPERAAS